MRSAVIALGTMGALIAACTGTEGTLNVELATAPGSTLLDAVESLRFTVTNPTQVTVVERTPDGFDVSLDLPAEGSNRAIVIDGLDATGDVIATGASPLFPVAAINARIVIYMAAPMSLAAAPVALVPARSELGVGELGYGAIFVGGREAAGGVSGAIEIYNAYDHTVLAGVDLPMPRAGVTVATTRANNAYVFGGRDAAGLPTGRLGLFQSSVPPNGAVIDLGDHPELARAGALAVRSGIDHFVVSGAPVLEIAGTGVAPREDITALPPVGASVTASDGTITAIFACTGPSTSGLSRFRDNQLDQLAGDPALAAATAAAIPGGDIVVVGGRHPTPSVEILRDLTRIDPITGAVSSQPALVTPRERAAVAATRRHLVVAGGLGGDGQIVPTAEVFDATSLAHLATLPLVVPRIGAHAIALANDQILIVGGVDGDGQPIETIELFTPPAPDL